MKNITRHTGTLEIIERLKNSKMGNPRYLCRCGGYTFRTAVDSSHGYSIQNYEGKEVEITIGTHYGVFTLNSIKNVSEGRYRAIFNLLAKLDSDCTQLEFFTLASAWEAVKDFIEKETKGAATVTALQEIDVGNIVIYEMPECCCAIIRDK